MMNVKPLHDERDYDWAISEVTRYFESKPKPGTDEGDRFEVLATLIKEYEDKHFEVLRRHPKICDRIHGKIASRSRQADRAQSRLRNTEPRPSSKPRHDPRDQRGLANPD
jgi:HTH-type transcriptional regulator/antitoxin HigA